MPYQIQTEYGFAVAGLEFLPTQLVHFHERGLVENPAP